MKKLLFFLMILVIGCSPRIKPNITNPKPALTIEDKVALLDIEHELPENVQKIGSVEYKDSGFSTDCSFNSLMNRARRTARENGANIVKVIEKKNPNLWSSCYRLKIDFYQFDGRVSSLPQYQLSLD